MSSLPPFTTTLTSDECQVYDRQLRIWGLESQQRIRQSRVLITSCSGMAVEAIKNLVLTGVGSLTIMDSKPLSLSDLTVNFFTTEAALNQNRVTASYNNIQQLNPNVKIVCETDSLDEKEEEYFKQFDVVLILNQPLSTQLRINAIIRTLNSQTATQQRSTTTLSDKKGIMYFAGETLGMHGYFFSDLGDSYSYIIQSKSDNETVNAAQSMSFVSLQTIVGAPLKDMLSLYKRTDRQIGLIYLSILTFLKYRDQVKSEKTCVNDLLGFKRRLCQQQQFDESLISDELLCSLLQSSDIQLSPVCAIFGGILSAEVVKVMSGKDEPYNNTCVYSATTGQALVRKIAVKQ